MFTQFTALRNTSFSEMLFFVVMFFCSVINNNSVEIVAQKMKCHRALQDFTQSDEEEAAFG